MNHSIIDTSVETDGLLDRLSRDIMVGENDEGTSGLATVDA
ncbi:hypothetical protein [Leuconostoc lactis]|nr:hypothetical protein [Leuconostoc lactis]